MKIVIFGLTLSSSWGNGHATLWRGLCKNLIRLGHNVTFFERDVPYYAEHRDLTELPGGKLILYDSWESVASRAEMEIREGEVCIVTSYCPDALAAEEAILWSSSLKVFYDLDAPVTLAALRDGDSVSYISDRGLQTYDLVLSYAGGETLDHLRSRLGARCVAPLYGSADPEVHHPVPGNSTYSADLSYLGTYAADRHSKLEMLFCQPATHRPTRRFLVGGSLYPPEIAWPGNVRHFAHVAPNEHRSFFASSRFTLNVTRGAMAEAGFCPSGRLFEAAACGCPIVSDAWAGLPFFFTPGEEILLADKPDDVCAALDMPEKQRKRISQAALERVLSEHTARHRAEQLEQLLSCAGSAQPSSEEH